MIEKILERLEEEANNVITNIFACEENDHEGIRNNAKSDAYEHAKEIVQEVAKEYSNGWIPCSERLPEEHDSIFARHKGTKKWNNAMFEKISDTVNVTVIDDKGMAVTTHAHTTDGKWSCDLLKANKSYRIIAWKPLPAPYQKGE